MTVIVRGTTRAGPIDPPPATELVTLRLTGFSSRPSTDSTSRPANSALSGTSASYQGASSSSGVVYGSSPKTSAVSVSHEQIDVLSSGEPTVCR